VKPAAVNTGFTRHAKNYMDVEPILPPPVYAPEVVARAIVYAAEHPQRDVYVGGAAKLISSAGQSMPGLMDRFFTRKLVRQQRSDVPATQRGDALHQAGDDIEQDQRPGSKVLRHSAYTHLTTGGRGWVYAGLGLALGCAALAAAPRSRKRLMKAPLSGSLRP